MTKKLISLRLEENTFKLLDKISSESHRSRSNVIEVLILKEAEDKSLAIFPHQKNKLKERQS